MSPIRPLLVALILSVSVTAGAGANPNPSGPVVSPLVTVDQVIAMKKAGVSDGVIIALIERDRPIFLIDATQTTLLKKQGVGDGLLLAMIATGRYWMMTAPQPCVTAQIAAPPPSSTRGIFFSRPTSGIFFAPPAAGCHP